MFQKIINLGLVFAVLAVSVSAQDYLKNWEKGTSPKEVGKRLAENWAARTFEFEQINPATNKPRRQFVIYPEICTWYGSLQVAKSTHA